ncbi:MAG: hypothetical protein KBB77_01205 [Candidatus Moranbacteria bacterium]|nr:hypothetical protein [Candidatus Moranbacteria bacterium]
MAKKFFYFSLSLFVLVLISLGAYNFAFKNNVNDPSADPKKKADQTEIIGLLPTGETRVKNAINENLIGATLGGDALVYYYSLDDQSLKKATLEGRNKTILMSNFPGLVTRVLWSGKQDKVLLLIQNSSGRTLWYLATLGNKSLTPLKEEMSRLTWDNLGEKIFYQYTDSLTKIRTLNIANPDGSEWKVLTNLGMSDYYLSTVPHSSLVSFWPRPTAKNQSALEAVSAVGENRRTIFTGAWGGEYSWAPNGETALVSGSNSAETKIDLQTISLATGATQSLSIPTLISKTAWSKDSHTLYYALPGGIPEEAILPDDYFSKPLFTKDTFWKVDLLTGKKTRLITLKESTQSFDSSDLFLSPSEDVLYFTDRLTKRLYQIDL